ncbi:MAG: hypothetical protein JWQ53_1024 [Klenkia sp.]|nr:hypothetical protein [Klenkia sp.]
MTATALELAASAHLEVLLRGEGAARPVTAVRLLDGTAAGGPSGDRGGVLVVLPWVPPRRGAALPPLAALLRAVLETGTVAPAAVAVVGPEDRVVNAPTEVLALVTRAGGTLLWGAGNASAVAARMQARLPAGEDASLAVAELLAGDLDLGVVVRRLSGALGVGLAVTDAAGRELAVAGDVGSAAEVDPLPLLLGGRRIGTLTLGGALSVAGEGLVGAVLPVLVLALRVHQGEERADAPAGRLLAAVLGDDLGAREAAVRRSRRLAVLPARPVVFLVLIPFGRAVSTTALQRLSRSVEPAVRAADDRGVVVVHEGSVVVLVGSDVDLDRLQRAMYRRVNVPLSLGAGRVVDDVRSYPGAHRQASRAAVVGRALGVANKVTRFDELGVSRLLFQLPEHERRSFARDVLGALAEDTPTAHEGRRVLRAFRATNGNVTEAARQLFLHHNTFRQRLTRLQEDVGDVLGDAERRLAVFVALDLHRLATDRDT